MEIKNKNSSIDLSPNSKPYLLKRIISDLFDIGVLFVGWFVITLGIINLGLDSTYNEYLNTSSQIQDTAMIESGYGIITYIDENTNTNGRIIYNDEKTNKKYIVEKVDSPKEEAINKYKELLNSNDEYKNAIFGASLHRYLISVISCLLMESIFFLLVPLINKKRATLGQLLTGISLYSLRFEKYSRWYHVLGRFLFIFLIESSLLYLLTGIYTFLLIPVLNLIMILLNKNGRTIRDLISGTMLIENKSYSPIN